MTSTSGFNVDQSATEEHSRVRFATDCIDRLLQLGLEEEGEYDEENDQNGPEDFGQGLLSSQGTSNIVTRLISQYSIELLKNTQGRS